MRVENSLLLIPKHTPRVNCVGVLCIILNFNPFVIKTFVRKNICLCLQLVIMFLMYINYTLDVIVEIGYSLKVKYNGAILKAYCQNKTFMFVERG